MSATRYANIVLIGFMGTGKSTVGRRVAELGGLQFVDLDARIVARDGRVITDIFAQSGEPFFRRLEHQAALEAAGQSGLVIATGGGIVLDPANTEALGRTGLLVCLHAAPETILARLEEDRTRPLLQHPDRMDRIRSLLGQRAALYAAIPHQLETDGRTPDELAGRILSLFRTGRTQP